MINIYTTELIINTVALVIAYLITETVSGYFRAWVAARLGDSTAQEMGFLSFNPFVHIDPVGFFTLIFFGLGWGVYVPIDYGALQKPYRYLKVFTAYGAESIAHFSIVLIALITLIKLLGTQALYVMIPMILSGSVSLATLTTAYPQTSSLILVLAILLVASAYLGLILGVLSLINNTVRFLAYWFLEEPPKGLDLFTTILPLFIFLFFANPIRLNILYCLTHISHFIATFYS